MLPRPILAAPDVQRVERRLALWGCDSSNCSADEAQRFIELLGRLLYPKSGPTTSMNKKENCYETSSK
jgi:hypothetical protein